ncbi:MFS transporter [Caulobacter sp. FWC2]|uniref:MFS transporter n=1 Tax=Caulobacter sp. FWC2 TaxID=69664 RepID=UPI000C153BFD|nr:MFS transporter [Caulobacter sp. FWC2]PIB91597.1 MFS transporter [Caulobacter sp. FWC2]
MVKLRLSIMMFAQYFAWGVWFVPLGAYMSKGLHFDTIIGAAYGMAGVATILSTLFVGMIADRFVAAEKLLGILSILAGAALLWVSTIRTSPSLFLFGCLLHFIFYASTIPLATAIAFNAMTDVGKEFPGIRVWGTVGWIVAGLLVGIVAGAAQTAMPMWIAAGIYIALGLYAFILPNTPPRATGRVVSLPALFGLDVILRHREPALWIFIACTLTLMIPRSFYDTYANAFFADKDLHLTLLGIRFEATGIQTAGQIFESLILVSLPFLLGRLGIKHVLMIGMGAWGVRFLLFAFGYQGGSVIMPMVLLGIIIHGVCYDFLIVSGQIYVDRKFDAEARSRAQSFFNLITQGIGVVVGSNIAGVVYAMNVEVGGGHDWKTIWIVPAVIACVAMLLFAFTFRETPGAQRADQADARLPVREPGNTRG